VRAGSSRPSLEPHLGTVPGEADQPGAQQSVREQSPTYVALGATQPRLEAAYSHVKEHHRVVRVRVTVRLCHLRVRRERRVQSVGACVAIETAEDAEDEGACRTTQAVGGERTEESATPKAHRSKREGEEGDNCLPVAPSPARRSPTIIPPIASASGPSQEGDNCLPPRPP